MSLSAVTPWVSVFVVIVFLALAMPLALVVPGVPIIVSITAIAAQVLAIVANVPIIGIPVALITVAVANICPSVPAVLGDVAPKRSALGTAGAELVIALLQPLPILGNITAVAADVPIVLPDVAIIRIAVPGILAKIAAIMVDVLLVCLGARILVWRACALRPSAGRK